MKKISRSGRQVIAELEERERARTGISSLKVRYNRVFGYYIEVSKSNLHSVPADYHRKQTIAGGERFITPALKEHESRVLGADERILERELDIFERLRLQIAAEAPRIQAVARALASLDVVAALAEIATLNNYTKPHVHDGDELVATDVRHPVVERRSPDPFVPNDVALNGTTSQLVILTGPNMGGKSTYLRQTALLSVLAQAGSFVPAREAKLPLVDRVYARVGASDNIARGQSTFMAEMQETASILHTATSRSLVVLDEIGRGTATFDGMSLAWAVAEHLATNPRLRPKTLFATHYHELTDLGRRHTGRGQCARDGAGMEGHDCLPAQGRGGPGGSELRHSGGAAGRPARECHRAGPRDSFGAGARRAGARRASLAQQHAGRAAATARPVPVAVRGPSSRTDCRPRHRPLDPARRAGAAGRSQEGRGPVSRRLPCVVRPWFLWLDLVVNDPDMLRRVFDSSQVPPTGFNRGFFQDPRIDRLLAEATMATDETRRRGLYGDVQQIVAAEAPYISLWYKTNVVVAQRSLTGIHLLPTADFTFLKDVARVPAAIAHQ